MFSFTIGLGVLFVGLVICVGSLYALISQKVIVNQEGQVTDIDIPFFGKMKTNVPSLVGIFIGAGLSFAVLMNWSAEPDTLPLKTIIKLVDGNQESPQKRDVFIGVSLPNHYRFERVLPNSEHEVEFPIIVPIDGSSGHFAVAYTVIGIDDSGYARRVVEVGNVRRMPDADYAEFKAELQLPTLSGDKP